VFSSGFFFLLLEDVSPRFFQTVSLALNRAKAVLKALADSHAHFWIKKQGEREERGGFWTLERRAPLGGKDKESNKFVSKYNIIEIENARSTWTALLERLPELKTLVPNAEELAPSLADIAPELDAYVSARCWTRIHGDCKAWNLFQEKDNEDGVLLIDMQWTGTGHPLQDVAYFLTTSLDVDVLDHFDALADFYVQELSKKVPDLPEDFRRQLDLIWLDYARVIVTGLWKRLSAEQIERYKDLVGPSMITKSRPHIRFIVERIHRKLIVEGVAKNVQQ